MAAITRRVSPPSIFRAPLMRGKSGESGPKEMITPRLSLTRYYCSDTRGERERVGGRSQGGRVSRVWTREPISCIQCHSRGQLSRVYSVTRAASVSWVVGGFGVLSISWRAAVVQ